MARIGMFSLSAGGDIFPLMPVVAELQRRGHEVVVGSSRDGARFVRSEGVPFASIGRPLRMSRAARQVGLFEADESGVASLAKLMDIIVGTGFDAALADAVALCEGCDLIVAHPFYPAGGLAAGVCGTPFVTMTIYPQYIPLADGPETCLALPGGAWAQALDQLAAFDRPINQALVGLGAAPVENAVASCVSAGHKTIALTPVGYSGPQSQWLGDVRSTGFTSWDRPAKWTSDGQLEGFLRARDEPLVVATLGTTLTYEPGQFYDVVAAVADELQARVLLLAARGDPDGLPSSPRVLVRRYAPLSALLPETSVLVHHSAFGGTKASLMAGVPSVAVPRVFDQHFHARRLSELGLSQTLRWNYLDPEAMCSAVRRSLGQGPAKAAEAASARMDVDVAGRAAADEILATLDGV